MRLDTFLAKKYGFSRNKIQQFIEANLVFVNGMLAKKPAQKIYDADCIEIVNDRRVEWVSRSAEKLMAFLEDEKSSLFRENIFQKICLDVGASTGGFSQVLLKMGAERVDAVEIGHDQLDESLKNHPKIRSFERTDIRDFFGEKSYATIVCDASFVRLSEILPAILRMADEKSHIFLLFKPQFEVEKFELSKKWVPKNEKIIQNAIENFEKILHDFSLKIHKKSPSKLKWEAGNQEWWFFVTQ